MMSQRPADAKPKPDALKCPYNQDSPGGPSQAQSASDVQHPSAQSSKASNRPISKAVNQHGSTASSRLLLISPPLCSHAIDIGLCCEHRVDRHQCILLVLQLPPSRNSTNSPLRARDPRPPDRTKHDNPPHEPVASGSAWTESHFPLLDVATIQSITFCEPRFRLILLALGLAPIIIIPKGGPVSFSIWSFFALAARACCLFAAVSCFWLLLGSRLRQSSGQSQPQPRSSVPNTSLEGVLFPCRSFFFCALQSILGIHDTITIDEHASQKVIPRDTRVV